MNGFIAVYTENEDYSVIELLGGYDIEMGHVLSGELESLGSEEIMNVSTQEPMDVIIQDCHASAQRAHNLLQG